MDQQRTPIFSKLDEFSGEQPTSFHVPGHKNGTVFPSWASKYFQSILSIDMTELSELDDLHAPTGIIHEAEALATDFFQSIHTYFLINGSTVGNLAMILAACSQGGKVLVQRNCHKSIMNGLTLQKVNPIFLAPEFNHNVGRYVAPSLDTLQVALRENPDVEAVILTYPDYFGEGYQIKDMIDLSHSYGVMVLVDEAHGVHFSKGSPFPLSALTLGADIVVQSAHKMAPAMTMTAFLHMNTTQIPLSRITYYLQVLQSSSPSYPLMASLDIARSYLALLTHDQMMHVYDSVQHVRDELKTNAIWTLLPLTENSDFLKITLHVKHFSGFRLLQEFESEGVYPELATHNQVLFIHGLGGFYDHDKLVNAIKNIIERLKKIENHATMVETNIFPNKVQTLAYTYVEMEEKDVHHINIENSVGMIVATAIIPYPPGIPLVLRGEKMTEQHQQILKQLLDQGASIQGYDPKYGISVFN